MISRVGIKKTQYLASGRGVHHLVDTRKTERIFGTCLIEIGIINTHAPFSILFLYKYRVSQLVGVVDFLNEASS